VVAVNDARTKHLFDNRYGTGQSTWDGIMRATNLLLAGKTVVVVGYGWCGRGVAQRARGLGARVIVCEVDPVAAIEALHDGFEVLPSLEAASRGDIFVTATGCARVLTREHFLRMKDGALLANAGHFDVEIDKGDLAALDREARGGSGVRAGQRGGEAGREVRPWVREYLLPGGKRLYLLAEGRLVNLVAGDGHPVEIMDLSFALQALSLGYLAGLTPGTLGPGVHPVPGELDEKVARLRLKVGGVRIDELTEEQREYLSGWR
jgi:adenosylhomocysteinase